MGVAQLTRLTEGCKGLKRDIKGCKGVASGVKGVYSGVNREKFRLRQIHACTDRQTQYKCRC